MKNYNVLMAGVFVLTLGILVIGCPSENSDDVSYTAVQTGGTSETTTSSGIELTFSSGVTGLQASDINITGARTGTLSGSGTKWTIVLRSVSTEGNITLSIKKAGIETGAKTVAVYKKPATGKNFEDVHYKGGSTDRDLMDIFIPTGDVINKPINAIIEIHGGALIEGNKGGYWPHIDTYKDKFIVARMNYRYVSNEAIATDFPSLYTGEDVNVLGIVQDIRAAIAYLEQTATEQGVFINKLIVMGGSAGAHLTLMYSYKENIENPLIPVAFCISFSGPTDFTDVGYWGTDLVPSITDEAETLAVLGTMYTGSPMQASDLAGFNTGNLRSDIRDKFLESSPKTYITNKVPPTIIVHSQDDAIVPFSNATYLHGRLEGLGVPNTFIDTDGLGHGLGAGLPAEYLDSTLEPRVIAAMNKYIDLYCN
ncbi:hypothetical protein FACS1894172_20810 [Spirochaetia bacterium]|nr:hypothetical protein FACS1894172_20810 [Spirochaetia bacterium]